jgi:flagellar protein FlaJ
MSIYESYRKAMAVTRPGLEPDYALAGALFASALAIVYVGFFVDLMAGGLLAVLIADLSIGYPLYKRDRRIAQVEASLPDVLSHMSTTLRAGGTIETSLKEVSRSNYGPITDELKTMMREVNEGKTFDQSFLDMAERTESLIVRRAAGVIVSAKRTGGGLVEALASIADDLRENARLVQERSARTMVQVLFIVIAANFVSPFIFGLVGGIILFLGSIGGGGVPPLFETILFYFKGYLVLSAVFSALAASMIRHGNITKTVIYAPVLLIITYVIFVAVNAGATVFFHV